MKKPDSLQVSVAVPTGRRGGAIDLGAAAEPKPETAGAKSAAKFGRRVLGALIAVPAVVLTVLAAVFLIRFAVDLASTWDEVLLLSVAAVAAAVVTTGLGVLSAIFEESRPHEVPRLHAAGRVLLCVSAAAVVFFAARSPTPAPVPSADHGRAAELRAALQTLGSPAEWDAWNGSQQCAAPGQRWRAACAQITARRSAQWAELQAIEDAVSSYSPTAVLGTGAIAGTSRIIRALLLGGAGLLCMVGGPILARWAAQVFLDLGRMIDGQPLAVAPVEDAAGSAAVALVAGAPSDHLAEIWFASRVIEDAGGRMSSKAAFADFQARAHDNGFPAPREAAFYRWLAAKAANSSPRIEAKKSSGVMVYDGWMLPGGDMILPGRDRQSQQVVDATYEDIPALPYGRQD